MTNFTITIDENNGKLLLIAKDKFKKFMVRNEKAAEVIKELANTIKIKKVVRSDTVDFIRCEDCDIAIDSSDGRIYNYVSLIKPLIVKAVEFEARNIKKDDIASKVTRENVLYRRKVVTNNYEPRCEEFRNETKKLDISSIIKSKVGQIAINAGATLLGGYMLVSGSIWAINQAINPTELKENESSNKEDIGIVNVITNDSEDYKSYVEYDNETTVEDTIYLSPDEEKTFDGVEFSYNNRCDSEKFIKCKAEYGDSINYWAYVYGVDSQIALGIATQERGVHSSIKDSGGGVGLFQIQESVWLNHEISAYNHLTGKIDTIKVTKDNIGDLDFNIRFGLMILSICYRQMQGNIPATVQCYNYGYGNMVKVIRNYCVKNGLEELDAEDMKQTSLTDIEKNVLSDQKNVAWTDEDIIKIINSNGYTIGDPYYLGHVFSYVPGSEFEVTFINRDGEENTLIFRNTQEYVEESNISR